MFYVGIIIVHNGPHYFVSVLWFSILIFFILISIDILCELHSLLDARSRSTRSILLLGLMSLVSFILVGHMSGWPAGMWSFLRAPWVCVNFLRVQFATPFCELCSRAPFYESCSRAPLASYICELTIFEWGLFGSWVKDSGPF